MTTAVRTTFRPDLVVNVSDQEFDQLAGQGLLYAGRFLYATFYSYSDGPLQDIEDVTIRIQGPSPSSANVVAATSVGVEHVGDGAYRYRWGTATTTAGTYLVTWAGVDVDDSAVTATENVVIS